MKGLGWALFAVWFPCCIVISVALYYTKNINCLWFLLIPGCMSIHNEHKESSMEDNDKKEEEE